MKRFLPIGGTLPRSQSLSIARTCRTRFVSSADRSRGLQPLRFDGKAVDATTMSHAERAFGEPRALLLGTKTLRVGSC
jgi:hypothetical protein